MWYQSIESKVLQIIPRRYEDAMNSVRILHRIQDEFRSKNVAMSHIKAAIKALRNQWHPILWNHHGIYLSYDRHLVEQQIQKIDHMKNGYFRGMSAMQEQLRTNCTI